MVNDAEFVAPTPGVRHANDARGANVERAHTPGITLEEHMEGIQKRRASRAEIEQMENSARGGSSASAPPSDSGIKVNMDVGTMVTGMLGQSEAAHKTVLEVLGKMIEMKDASNNVVVAGFKKEVEQFGDALKEAREKADTAPGSKDPLEVYRQVKGLMDEAATGLKDSLGLAGTTGGSDLAPMLEIKKLEIGMEARRMEFTADQERMKREHTEGTEDRRRQWKLEDEQRQAQYAEERRRWDADFALKQQELSNSASIRNQAADGFGAIVEGIAGAMNKSRTEGATDDMPSNPDGPTAQSTEPAAEMSQTSSEEPLCPECAKKDIRTILPWVAGAEPGTPITCPTCQSVFEVRDPNAAVR